MIVAVKRNKKGNLLKILLIALVSIGIFNAYYVHMNKVKEEQRLKEIELKQTLKLQKEQKEKEEKIAKEKKEMEKAILSEIEKAVDLIGQENIQNAKIIEDKIIFICNPETDLEPLMVRYGAMALMKKNLNETIIAVDINFILKSRLNAK